MKLSVLEQSSLSEGSSAAEDISNTVALSKELDRLGYSRIWLSEHHNLNILQGSTPEVLLAAIGAQTTRIRLGSGGVIRLHPISARQVSAVELEWIYREKEFDHANAHTKPSAGHVAMGRIHFGGPGADQ